MSTEFENDPRFGAYIRGIADVDFDEEPELASELLEIRDKFTALGEDVVRSSLGRGYGLLDDVGHVLVAEKDEVLQSYERDPKPSRVRVIFQSIAVKFRRSNLTAGTEDSEVGPNVGIEDEEALRE